MINPIKIILYQLYLLQLEEYDVRRFSQAIKRTDGKVPAATRKGIVWTPKMILITSISLALFIGYVTGASVFSYRLFQLMPLSVILFIKLLIHTKPFHICIKTALFILRPIDTSLKNRIINKAKEKLLNYPNLRVIGIAGSYGKTTMKEVLYSVLSQKYKVIKTDKNINTPIGISRQILAELSPEHEIYIVEIGEYYRGDIAEICDITPPEIAVITGINEAHLEKMGSLNTTIPAIFEVADSAKEKATVVINKDDKRVAENYRKYTQKEIIEYSIKGGGDFTTKNITLSEHSLEMTFEVLKNRKHYGRYNVPILGEYIVGDIIAAIQIAELSVFKLSPDEIKRGVENIQPVPHRLEPIINKQTGVLVIDDSYNGNPDGVEEAIKLLGQFKKRRKVYVTPGLVETGEKSAEIHYNIGKTLSDVADIVVLIKNSATPHIAKGLTENGFNEKNIVWFDTSKEAHGQMGEVTRLNDVVLFQNDWPDNYL